MWSQSFQTETMYSKVQIIIRVFFFLETFCNDQVSVQQEDITILSLFTPNKRDAKYTKIMALDRKQSRKEVVTL